MQASGYGFRVEGGLLNRKKSSGGKSPSGPILWMFLIIIVMFGLYSWLMRDNPLGGGASQDYTYSEFRNQVKENPGQFQHVTISSDKLRILMSDGNAREISYIIDSGDGLAEALQENKVAFDYKRRPRQWINILGAVFPLLLFLGFILFMQRQAGGGSQVLSFGKSRAKPFSQQETKEKTTFENVAGCDEAKEALEVVVQFLKEPKKFEKLGGRIPKGVLLVGPPGTGKTLLAKAVAGESDANFFSISGSDFVEMFVGVGASRVRDLFEQGKKNQPCIIFIDELDAVGRHRGAGIGGGHDEREQTLNQLLVEMDGFDVSGRVIVIAATNRPDVLDPALLRAGRFDQRVVVDLPDVRGREAILNVHADGKPLGEDVKLDRLAKGTPTLSGADLQNIMNTAAVLAAMDDLDAIDMASLEKAKDMVLMGAERRSLVVSEQAKELTAIHEAGHALVAHHHPHADPNYKVTIIPRGRALGLTVSLPEEEHHNYTKDQLMGHICRILGGRIAEEIVFGDQTTGAQNDFMQATNLARRMVCEFGMSEKLGPLAYRQREEQVFLGRDIASRQDFSEQTALLIDQEVRSIVDNAWATASGIIDKHQDDLRRLAEELLEKETLETAEIEQILGPRPDPPPRLRIGPPESADSDNVSESGSNGAPDEGVNEDADGAPDEGVNEDADAETAALAESASESAPESSFESAPESSFESAPEGSSES